MRNNLETIPKQMREKMRLIDKWITYNNPHSLASWNDSQTDETKKYDIWSILSPLFHLTSFTLSIKNQSHQI